MKNKRITLKSIKLEKKEHPLRFLYPLAECLHQLFSGKVRKNDVSKVNFLMKQLCVRENVEEELYIYSIKKIATVIAVFLGIGMMGVFMVLVQDKSSDIKQVFRGDYGTGTKKYTLQMEYEGETGDIEISVGQVELSEDEVLSEFEKNYEDIVRIVLADNTSPDNISRPLNLIKSYEGISIHWEIDNPDALDYKGEISTDIEENEYVPVILTATFSMGGISEKYQIPVILTCRPVTAGELLEENVKEAVENNNSVYEKEVSLPDTINGKSVFFRELKDNNVAVILVLGVIAGILIIVGYDKNLEKKVKERNEQMLLDFTEIVFKLSLLYEAGISIFRAWEKIIEENEKNGAKASRYAYMEMRLTLEKIKSGVGEAEAYGQFGKRCGLHQYIKLGNILEQNLHKGTKGMKELLHQEAQEAFEERKRLARKKGEEAGTKMLIPMVMMLIVVIIIVAVPALMSMEF